MLLELIAYKCDHINQDINQSDTNSKPEKEARLL